MNVFNTYTAPVQSVTYGSNDNQSNIQENNNNIIILKSCEKQLGNIDNVIESVDNVNIEILTMIANQQKQVVLAMLGQNPEQTISLMLAASIEIYAQQLEKIYGWTQGGVEMFRSSLMLMFENIKKDGVDSIELEDLFQLALLEIMVNAEEYGLEDWYDKNKVHISHVLESTGSGSHSIHETDYNTPEKMAEWASLLYESLKKEGNIPPDSFLGQMMAELDKKVGPKHYQIKLLMGGMMIMVGGFIRRVKMVTF